MTPNSNLPKYRCTCSDPLCPAHPGHVQCDRGAEVRIVSTMGVDELCDMCVDDAIASGVLRTNAMGAVIWVAENTYDPDK